MLNHSLYRIVVFGLLLAGAVSYSLTPVCADDAPAESTDDTATDIGEQEAEEEETPDSEGGVQVEAKIVVIGPDGERREYEFGRTFGTEGFHLPGLTDRGRLFRFGPTDYDGDGNLDLFAFAENAGGERFFIGLQCIPADDTLRQQLQLDGHGLVVQSVVPEMPAAEAGLQEHDVLLSIGDEPLDSVDELMDLVQQAGASPITVKFLRAGEEQTVEITPVKSLTSSAFDGPQNAEEASEWIRRWVRQPRPSWKPRVPIATYPHVRTPVTVYQHSNPVTTFPPVPVTQYRVEAVGPGILFRDSQRSEEKTDQFEALEERVEELTRQIDELRQALEDVE